MTRISEVLRRLLHTLAPPEPRLAPVRSGDGGSPTAPGSAVPDTDDDYLEMAKERELRILMAHWL